MDAGFAFYHRRKTNLNRLYDQRIDFLKYNNYLGEKLCPVYTNQKERILTHLKEYSRSINTESYDFLYYYISDIRQPSPLLQFTWIWCVYVCTVKWIWICPVFLSSTSPQTLFYNQIRKLTTGANKSTARIPTNYATTASSEVRYLMRDVFLQGIDYSKKAIRMFGRKFFNSSFFVSAPLSGTLMIFGYFFMPLKR